MEARFTNWSETLYGAVTERFTPEKVAGIVLDLFKNPICESGWTTRSHGRQYSWMASDFQTPKPLWDSSVILAKLIGQPPLTIEQASDMSCVSDLCQKARQYIHASTGPLNFKDGRLNRSERKSVGLDISKDKYNRIFRVTRFLEVELEKNGHFGDLCKALRIAKSALITDLSLSEFGKDAQTALFVAYMSARLNMRSTFTNGPQTRAFDEHAEALLIALKDHPNTNWFAVAHAFPREDVLQMLTDEEKLQLLGLATEHMQNTAKLLAHLSSTNDIDPRQSTTVKRGDDSSSWNYAAGAWNKIRDWWVALVQDLGGDSLFDSFLPGKVMRLMAADVVAWHRRSGGQEHPDQLVSQDLPKPWDVVLGDAKCTKDDVIAACEKHDVDPNTSGWVSARPRTQVENWHPTPELVHGVTINHPALAFMLRKAGWFAGPSKSKAGV